MVILVRYMEHETIAYQNDLNRVSIISYMSLTKIKSSRILMIFFYPKTDWNPLFGS